MINVVDEVLSGEALYTIVPITDSLGNTVYKIELVTSVTQAGTPLNKALFDSIDYDIKNIPNFTISKSYTDTFNDAGSVGGGMSIDKTIQLSNDRFFIIKSFIDESFVSSSYRYTKQSMCIFDAKEKKFLVLFAPYIDNDSNVIGMSEMSTYIYQQGQGAFGASYVTLQITDFNLTTRQLTLQIKAHKCTNAQITWTFEASSLDGKF